MKKSALRLFHSYHFWWALAIFMLVLAIYLIPFSTWHFDIDDCGVIWHSRFASLYDFFQLFIKGKDGVGLCFPSNYHVELSDCRPFLNSIHSFYRPLTLVFFGIQYFFFGPNPYPYFFVMMLFHAINSALIFNIINTLYPSRLGAACAALFFGFHMSYWGWMGWIAAQPYTISLFFLLLATIFFVWYLQTSRMRYNIAACLLYGLAAFLFEFTFVFPIFICSLWFIFPFRLRTTTGLWATAFFFLAMRHLVCSSTAHASGNLLLTIKQLCGWMLTRRADYLSFIVDLGNISFISPGNQLLKGGIIVVLASLFLYGFIKSSHKKLIVFCLFNMGLFLWPAILKQYTLRYLYYALPFYAIMLLILIDPLQHRKKTKFFWGSMCWLIVIGNAYFVTTRMIDRAKELNIKANAVATLVAQPEIHGRALCFLAIPRGPFASGFAQHLWMLGINKHTPIFYDPSTFVEYHPDIRNTDIHITPITNGFRISSRNRPTVHWACFGGENMRLGTKKILSMDDHGVYDIAYTYENIAHLNPLLVTWDYEQKIFKSVQNIHISV